MKRIFYSQRVEIINSYGERRDCADQRIPQFLASCELLPVAVPNVPNLVRDLAEEITPSGIFLTGGNSLVKYGGNAPERDETEASLAEWGIRHRIPVFGICRGMQFLADFFGGKIVPVSGHVGTRHAVYGGIFRGSVNSYHTLSLQDLPADMEVLARAEDNSIEAFRHKHHAIMAVAWHPEREMPCVEADLKMIRDFFAGRR